MSKCDQWHGINAVYLMEVGASVRPHVNACEGKTSV